MFENLITTYPLAIGSAIISYLANEVIWHYKACSLYGETIQPCLFKKIKNSLLMNKQNYI